jgi:hypothetical protein
MLLVSFLVLCAAVVVDGWSWSKAALTQAPRVSGHSVGYYNTNEIILFGGLTGPAGSPCTDETWHYDAASESGGSWSLLHGGNTKPRVRMYGASAVLDNNLYIFGGWDPGAPGSGGEFLDDIWQLDLATRVWLKVDTKLPYPVSRHTACAISSDDSIVLHTYQGILVYKKDGTLAEQETSGQEPEGLSMCATAPLSSTKMLLFGGSTKTQQMSCDAYVLDCESWTWTKLNNVVGEEAPPILASACAAPLAKDQAVIFGGASIGSSGYGGGMGLIPQDETWVLQVKNGDEAHWTKVDFPDKPEGRVAATICPIGSRSFLLQGGYHPTTKTTFDQPWILSQW